MIWKLREECKSSAGGRERLVSTGRNWLAGLTADLVLVESPRLRVCLVLGCRSETQFGLQLRAVGIEAIRGGGLVV